MRFGSGLCRWQNSPHEPALSPPFLTFTGRESSGACPQKGAQAKCSAVRDWQDICESAVGRPILLCQLNRPCSFPTKTHNRRLTEPYSIDSSALIIPWSGVQVTPGLLWQIQKARGLWQSWIPSFPGVRLGVGRYSATLDDRSRMCRCTAQNAADRSGGPQLSD